MSLVRFVGGLAFDTVSGELRRGKDTILRLEPQPASVLRALAARAGELVTHEDLGRAVWDASTHVKRADSLHYCVRQIRAAFGDSSRQPLFIETIPRRGYRLRPECLARSGPRSSLRGWTLSLTVATALFLANRAPSAKPGGRRCRESGSSLRYRVLAS